MIEVEPTETTFGLGFSEELARCIDPVLDMVRAELDARSLPEPKVSPEEPEPMAELVGYAEDHITARRQSRRAPAFDVPGLALAGRVRPWGVNVDCCGDWFDAIPLESGSVGIVVGNVAGRGVEVAPAMADLRAAVRAYAVVDGESPSALLGRLDRLATSTGLGRDARLLYLVFDPATGDVRMADAGGCPPLLVGHGFVEEPTLHLGPESVLLLFTDGLVENRVTPRAAGLERLRQAAAVPTDDLDELCEHVLTVSTSDGRRATTTSASWPFAASPRRSPPVTTSHRESRRIGERCAASGWRPVDSQAVSRSARPASPCGPRPSGATGVDTARLYAALAASGAIAQSVRAHP